MAAILKKRAIANFGFRPSSRNSIVPEHPAKAEEAKRRSRRPKSEHPAFDGESDSEPNESDEEWGNKGLLQPIPPPRPLTILSNRVSGLPSSPARVNGLPSIPVRRPPGQSTITPFRASEFLAPSSALARPPLQPHLPKEEVSLPPSQSAPKQDVQSQIRPSPPVLSSQVQTPTLYLAHSRPLPPDDPPQPSRTLSSVPPQDLLRPSPLPTPKTPAFDIIDAHDYMKRVMFDQQQPDQQWQQIMPDPISPIVVPPPFTYTNGLEKEQSTEDEDGEGLSHQQSARREEMTPSPLDLQHPSEGGPSRDSHDEELPNSENGPSPPVPPPGNPSEHPQVEVERGPRPLLEKAPHGIRSTEAMSNLLHLEDINATPSSLTPASNIATPTVPPVPPRLGPLIVGGANASHRRYTPLSIPGEALSPGDELSPVTHVGLARTPRTASFDVVLVEMGENKVERSESATNVVPNAMLPTPGANVSEELRGVQRWQTFNVSVPTQREMIEVKVHSPQGSVGRVGDEVVEGHREIHEERLALSGRENFDTSAVAHGEEPEEYDEGDGGEFEMMTATEVAKLGPPGRSDSLLDGEVEVDIVRTAVDSLRSALSSFPHRRGSSSSGSDQEEDRGWYPRLPTDGVVDLIPKDQRKLKSKPVPIPAPKVKETNRDRDTAPKGPGRLVEKRPPPIRPPSPPALGFNLRVLDETAGGEEKQNQRIEQFESGWGGLMVGDESTPLSEPAQVSLPMKIPTPPSPFRPLAIALDTVSLGDMLRENAAPAAPRPPRVQAQYVPIVSPKGTRKELSGSELRPALGDSDVLDFEEALSWKPAPVKLPAETQGEFGRRELGRNVATVQGTRKEFDSSSRSRPRSSTLPTRDKSVPSPLLMPLDTPPYHPTRPILNDSVSESFPSMPLDMLPILPPAPASSPPRPKHTLAGRNPNLPPVVLAPESRAPPPLFEAPYKERRGDNDVSFSDPWAPSAVPSLDPVAGRNHPPVAPPQFSVPRQQVKYHPRSSSLPRQTRPSTQPSTVVTPLPKGYVRPSPPNGPGMDKMPEMVTRSYHEKLSSEVSPFPAANGKEKKKPSFAGLVGCLLKAKKANKKVKEAKYGLESVEEHEAPREARERGHAKQGYKKEAPIIVEFILPPKQPIDGDGWVSREQRVQPTATGGVFATDDIRDQPVSYTHDETNVKNQFPPTVRASQYSPSSYVPSSRHSIVPARPPLVYYPSVPISTHVTSISMRLEAERGIALSGGVPIPSLNTASIPNVISSLSHINTRIGEACDVLTKVIIASRITTGESGVGSGGVQLERMSVKVERDMRTRLCEFLTGDIFGRFSVALSSEEDRALREAHGDFFVRYSQLLSARWRVLACTSTAPSPEATQTILDSLLQAGVGAVLGNSNPDSILVFELSALLRPVFNIALELSTCLHVDMVEHDYGVFSGTPLGGIVDLQVEESHDPYVTTPRGARNGGFWSLGLRRARWEGDGEERRRVTEVLVRPKVYVDSKGLR